jgi:hypothetical protein
VLPAVDADQVLALADHLYTSHRLMKADAHTIECPTGGVTYMPIPRGAGPDYAGLLSIDLPAGIKKGEVYDVTVKQVTSSLSGKRFEAAETVNQSRGWRRVLGVFRLTIPVSTKAQLLPVEEKRLATMKWILGSIPHQSRWYPVFVRYVAQLGDRVKFMGGDPDKVPPSPGELPHPRPGRHGHGEERVHFEGKVLALIYDRFGDFDGFVLDTEDGERRFHAREHRIEELVRGAWAERIATVVVVERDDPERPEEILLVGPPAAW